MRISLLPPAEGPDPVAASVRRTHLVCPNPPCRGDLAILAGAEDLYCAACGTVVVVMGANRAVWLRRRAEPQTCSTLELQAPARAG